MGHDVVDVTIEQQGDTTIVRPAGRLDFAASAGFLEVLTRSRAGTGTAPARVVIDATALEYVSSAGLRAFLVAARRAKGAGIRTAVCRSTPSVREDLKVSGFDRLIPVLGTLPEAFSA